MLKPFETTNQSCTDSVVPLIPIVLGSQISKAHESAAKKGLCGCCLPTGHRGTLLVQFGDRFPWRSAGSLSFHEIHRKDGY